MTPELQEKVYNALSTIRLAASHPTNANNQVLLYSGGKDSVVVAHLLTMAGVSHRTMCDLTLLRDWAANQVRGIAVQMGLEPDYTSAFGPRRIMKHWDLYVYSKHLKPSQVDATRHWVSIRKYLDKNPTDVVYTGRRTEENTVKAKCYFHSGYKALMCHPIREWTLNDVWDYTMHYKLPYIQGYTPYKPGHLTSTPYRAWEAGYKTGEIERVYEVWLNEQPQFVAEAAKEDHKLAAWLRENGK